MEIDCPHGWKNRIKLGSITIEDTRVNIHAGICDCPDLCGITTCEFYDITREGTRRYNAAVRHSETLEGHYEDEAMKQEYKRRLMNTSG